MPDDKTSMGASMRCLLCKSVLQASGQEPYRYVCSSCGQNFIAVFQLMPVDPLRPPQLQGPEEDDHAV